MAENIDTPVANAIGAGLILNDEGNVSIVILLSDAVEDESETTPMAGISLPLDAALLIIEKLQRLLKEAEFANEAIGSMGKEAATEYLDNWSKRVNSPLN